MREYKKFSLNSRGLRHKLRIAVHLMSVLPLLVCIYIVMNYVLPRQGYSLDVGLVVAISIAISFAGYSVIKHVFDRIVSISSEAKLIASGEINRQLDATFLGDEVGDLASVLNQLTQRIRDNMDEIKGYGEKTTEINIGIQRRVLVLSNLLQISSLITQGAELEDILKIIVEKSRLLANSDVAYLLFREHDAEILHMKIADGINAQGLLNIKVGTQDQLFDKLISTNKPLIIDKENRPPEKCLRSFYEKFDLNNTLASPVYLRGRVMAILGIGNSRESFLYSKDDTELLDIFSKQAAVALENDILLRRVKELEIKDALTGLYNEGFIRSRLQEEIRRAIIYQRPCSFILFDIDNFRRFQESFGSIQAEASIKKIASLIKDSVTEIDRLARFSDHEFALVLPERTKRQARDIAEDIRNKIEVTFAQEHNAEKRMTLSGAVSENPLDGTEAEELITKAKNLLAATQKKSKNCIVI